MEEKNNIQRKIISSRGPLTADTAKPPARIFSASRLSFGLLFVVRALIVVTTMAQRKIGHEAIMPSNI